jgi:hypothetical protein
MTRVSLSIANATTPNKRGHARSEKSETSEKRLEKELLLDDDNDMVVVVVVVIIDTVLYRQ